MCAAFDEVLPGLVGVEAHGEHVARGLGDGTLAGVPGAQAAERADHGQDVVAGGRAEAGSHGARQNSVTPSKLVGTWGIAAASSSSAAALAAVRVERLAMMSPLLATSLRGPAAALVPAR